MIIEQTLANGCESAAERYFTLLQRWVREARRELQAAPDDGLLLYYGSGESGWGAQTVQKAILAFATVATDPAYDAQLMGAPREVLLGETLALFRYTLATHCTGRIPCTDLLPWGNTWISVLGLERSYPALSLLDPYLTSCDREQLRTLLLSEAEWILTHYPVAGGLRKNNRPEANLWNAAFLWKVLHHYPEAVDQMRYRQKVAALIRHGISTPSSHKAIAPEQLAADGEGIGPNFYDSFALHHHGYLNVGYIAICLSQVALLHYSCRELGFPEPEGWQEQSREVWELLKLLSFPDGRLIRVGGDTRVRYCYCQDYQMVNWHYARDLFDDDAARSFFEGWVNILECEVNANGTGAFLSQRGAELKTSAAGYYFRLEADRAVALALSRVWARKGLSDLGTPHDATATATYGKAAANRWSDASHGSYLLKTDCSVMSWTWEAAAPSQGLFVPANRSDLAEWHQNLSGEVLGLGRRNWQEVEDFHGVEWHEGFATAGSAVHTSDGWATEGQFPARLARQQTACVAWGDEMVLFQTCTALRRATVESIKGVHLNVPNDIFNQGVRRYRFGNTEYESRFDRRTPEEKIFPGRELLIENTIRLELVRGGSAWSLYRPSERNVCLKIYPGRDFSKNPGTLLSEQVCYPLRVGPLKIEKDEVLFDVICHLTLVGKEARAVKEIISDDQGKSLLPGLKAVRCEREGRKSVSIYFNAGESEAVLSMGNAPSILAISRGERLSTGQLRIAPLGLVVIES